MGEARSEVRGERNSNGVTDEQIGWDHHRPWSTISFSSSTEQENDGVVMLMVWKN